MSQHLRTDRLESAFLQLQSQQEFQQKQSGWIGNPPEIPVFSKQSHSISLFLSLRSWNLQDPFFFALYSCAEHRAAHYPRVALAHIRFTHPLPARHNIIIGSRDRPHNGRSRVICADWYARGSTVECAPEKKLGPRRGGEKQARRLDDRAKEYLSEKG